MLWFAGLGFSLDDDEDINPIGMTSADEELSVDLLRYIGEMLFELFSMLCIVILTSAVSGIYQIFNALSMLFNAVSILNFR